MLCDKTTRSMHLDRVVLYIALSGIPPTITVHIDRR